MDATLCMKKRSNQHFIISLILYILIMAVFDVQHWSTKFCGNHFKPQSIPLAPIYVAHTAAYTCGINTSLQTVALYQSAQVNRLDNIWCCDIDFNRSK